MACCALCLRFLGVFVVILAILCYHPARLVAPSELKRGFDRKGSVQLTDGRRLAFYEVGPPDGSPVLYFHGTPASGQVLISACSLGNGIAFLWLTVLQTHCSCMCQAPMCCRH